MRNHVLWLVMALAMQETNAKRDDYTRYATMLESLLEKQKNADVGIDQPAQKKTIQPRDHSALDEPDHPEVQRGVGPSDHPSIAGEHR